MILFYTHRFVFSPIVTTETSSATGEKRCRCPQSNIRPNSGNTAEERKPRKIVGHSGEEHHTRKPQNQLTRAHWSSRRLNQQPGSLHRTDQGLLHLCDDCVVGLLVGLLTVGVVDVSDSFAVFWDSSPHTRLPCPTLI